LCRRTGDFRDPIGVVGPVQENIPLHSSSPVKEGTESEEVDLIERALSRGLPTVRGSSSKSSGGLNKADKARFEVLRVNGDGFSEKMLSRSKLPGLADKGGLVNGEEIPDLDSELGRLSRVDLFLNDGGGTKEVLASRAATEGGILSFFCEPRFKDGLDVRLLFKDFWLIGMPTGLVEVIIINSMSEIADHARNVASCWDEVFCSQITLSDLKMKNLRMKSKT